MNGEIRLFSMLAEMGVSDKQIKSIIETLRKHRMAIAAEHIVAVHVIIEPDGYISAYIYLSGGWMVKIYPYHDDVDIEHASW